MRENVSSEELDEYRSQGFVVMNEFLSPEEVEVWREAVEHAVVARERDPDLLPSIVQERWPTEYAFRQHMNLWQTDDRMRNLLLDPRIGRIAAALMGVDAVRIWYDQSFIKAAWAAPTPLHQDNPYWAFHHEAAATLWVALDDVDSSNGALVYLPGSHVRQQWLRCDGDGIGDVLALFPQWSDIEPVCTPVSAGSVIWHNGLCVHGSGANMTRRQRRALNVAFMPVGARYNGISNILPDAARYRVGDVLADDARHPVVWPATYADTAA